MTDLPFALSPAVGPADRALALIGGAVPVPVPTWFDWQPAFSVRRAGAKFSTSLTSAALRPASGTVLFVSPLGNNANAGTSVGLAKRSIASAYNAGATTIICDPGDYTRQNGFEGLTIAARDLVLENADPTSGPVIIGRFEPPSALSWVQNGTYPNVWSCSRASAVAVRDRSRPDANGNIERLVPRASVDLVAANPGSQFISGSTVNISLTDGRQPDANVLVFLSGNNAVFSSTMAGKTFWIGEGFEFWGGDCPLACLGLSVPDGSRIVASGTRLKYGTHATNGNGYNASNLAESYLFGCRAEANLLDGFNYHAVGGGTPKALEIDCIGRANGLTGGSNNGSTAHEDYRVIRIGGQYVGNEGPQLVDINTSRSWNLGCRTRGGALNFRTQDSAIMILDACRSESAITDLSVGGGMIYYRDLVSAGAFTGSPTPF